MKLVSVLLLWPKVSVLFFSALFVMVFCWDYYPSLYLLSENQIFLPSETYPERLSCRYTGMGTQILVLRKGNVPLFTVMFYRRLFLNLSKVCFQARTHTLLLMMMMNFFCRMVDRRKVFSLISSWDHCQRSSPSRISDTPRARFEPAQNLSSGF